MHAAKRTLAIVALTTSLVSCSGQTVPASTPTLQAEPLRLYATTATLPLLNDLIAVYSEQHPLLAFDVQTGGYQTLLTRLLASDDAAFFITNHLAADSPLWAAPLGQDGIGIIAHPRVGISALTLDQLRAIYQGNVTRWNEVGGRNMPVVVVSREDGSATRAEFERLVMGRRQTTAAARVAPSSSAMLATVADTPGSIGSVSSGSLAGLDTAALTLAIEGARPSLETVADGSYPLRSTLYITGTDAPVGAYYLFISWMQSPEGQAIIARRHAPLLPAVSGTP
jgi:phosphate transport system substrate-binding protein